jgi:hypothetical protein
MTNPERIAMIAPCGLDCGRCEVHTAKDNPALFDFLVSVGIPKDKIPCAGCRNIKGACPVIPGTCATWKCVQSRGLEFCHECGDFPCDQLHPAADRSNELPHNLKVYNLCLLKRIGAEKFITVSGDSKLKYFKGKMTVGKGPSLPS